MVMGKKFSMTDARGTDDMDFIYFKGLSKDIGTINAMLVKDPKSNKYLDDLEKESNEDKQLL